VLVRKVLLSSGIGAVGVARHAGHLRSSSPVGKLELSGSFVVHENFSHRYRCIVGHVGHLQWRSSSRIIFSNELLLVHSNWAIRLDKLGFWCNQSTLGLRAHSQTRICTMLTTTLDDLLLHGRWRHFQRKLLPIGLSLSLLPSVWLFNFV